MHYYKSCMPLGAPPKCCSIKWITIYVLLLLCLVSLVLAVGILYYIPSVHEYKPFIAPNNTVLLPIQPDPVWLAGVTFTVELDCKGVQLYSVPCSELNHSNHRINFGMHGDYEHIYCLNGSVFYFDISDISYTNGICVELVDDERGTLDSKCRCDPGVDHCIHLNDSHPSDNITVRAEGMQGSFYSWSTCPHSQVNFSINQYYYDASLYSSYLVTNLSDSYTLHFHENFQPANLISPDTCLLLHISALSKECSHGKIKYLPQRRQDILFWPGLAGGIIILIIINMAGIQSAWFFNKKNRHMREMIGLNA